MATRPCPLSIALQAPSPATALFMALAPWLAAVALLAATLAAAGPAWSAESLTPAQLATKVQARYKTVDALAAGYRRLSRFVAAGAASAREVDGAGHLTWARPLSLRLEQMEPRHELVVTSQKGVWWVRPQRKRADLYPLEHFTNGLRSLLDALAGLSRLEESFKLLAPTDADRDLAQGNPVLVLEPKKRRVDLKRLVLWFEPNELVLNGFSIQSLVGDVTTYWLQDTVINPPLPTGTFAYDPPEGFEVRDQAAKPKQ